MAARHYVAGRGLAVSIYLALRLKRPLFLEGEPGVGKTEVAKVLAATLDAELIRLQCYEGLDISHAVYEWNYPAADSRNPPARRQSCARSPAPPSASCSPSAS